MHQEEKDTLLERIKAICRAADRGELVSDPCIRTEDGRIVHCHITVGVAADFHMSTEALKLDRFLVDMLWHGYTFVVGCGDSYLEWYVNPTVEYLFNKVTTRDRKSEKCHAGQILADEDLIKIEVAEENSLDVHLSLLRRIEWYGYAFADGIGIGDHWRFSYPDDKNWGQWQEALMQPRYDHSEANAETAAVMKILLRLNAHILHPWERKRPHVQSAAAGATDPPTEC